jgi:hypothetical protein
MNIPDKSLIAFPKNGKQARKKIGCQEEQIGQHVHATGKKFNKQKSNS